MISPGLDDPAGPEKDNKNISEMVKKLKELDTVHLFFVVFNGQLPRLTRFFFNKIKINLALYLIIVTQDLARTFEDLPGHLWGRISHKHRLWVLSLDLR